MDKDTALKLALEALEIAVGDDGHDYQKYLDAVDALKETLAQPAPVPDTEAHYKAVVEGVQKLFNDKRTQPAPVQEWMKPNPKCDEACLFQCTKGFTQFPECATTPPAQPKEKYIYGTPLLDAMTGKNHD